MNKLLVSILTVGVVGAAAFAGANAFFSDTETSTGNVLSGGSLDLKVDSTAHYAGMICDAATDVWVDDGNLLNNSRPELLSTACVGSWTETDLDLTHQFFNLDDIKPGDEGENTISLHVYDNDAWGRVTIDATADNEVSCNEPEIDDEALCAEDAGNLFDGELGNALLFNIWLDEGATPGFQNGDATPGNDDALEGNNILDGVEVALATSGPLAVDEGNQEQYEFNTILAAAYVLRGCSDVDGNTGIEYGSCHGYAQDGRMVGSTTYYLGFNWNLPGAVGNEVQTDSFMADISFETLQHRNNPSPVWAP